MGDFDSFDLPKAIGRYQVIRLLGSGAMGSVVLAEDPRIKRKVAIKLMKLDGARAEADQQEYLARFQREAEVSGLLNHPGIVAIYDVGEEEGFGPFLAMEFVPGRPLDGILKAGVMPTLKERLKIAAGLAEALDHAHAKGVIHRDVKPGNVMVGEDGRPKLMDFGIAKREDASLTQTGTFLGTPSYASPEQIKEGTVDGRSDIFSLGVLVFELMSGQSPFPGTSINTILYRIVNEAPVEVQPPVLGVLPEGWQRVFGRVLAKRPEERYPTGAAFVRDLLDAVVDLGKDERREVLGLLRMSGEGPLPAIVSTSHDETMVVPRPEPRGKDRPWLLAVLLGAAAVGGWFLFRGPRGTRLQIHSQPSGAQVFVNDLAVGNTPVNQPLVAGDRLRLEMRGHQSMTYIFKPGEAPPTFPLQPIVSEEILDSVPPGAAVVLDEKPLEGETPLKVRWNQGQAHRLTLTLGHLVHASDYGPGETPGGRAFELKEATQAEGRPEPPLDPNAPGILRVNGPFSVRIKVDGREVGEIASGGKVSLPPGARKVEALNLRYFYREVRSVEVAPGQTFSITVPPLATLTIGTFPGIGKVVVDGQDTGLESDGSSLQVCHGRHTIVIRGAKGTRTETLEVTGDRTLNLPL